MQLHPNNILDLLAQIENTKKQLDNLEQLYKNRRTGRLYQSGIDTFKSKLSKLLQRLENFGCEGNLLKLNFSYRDDNLILCKGEMFFHNIDASSISIMIFNLNKYKNIIPDTLVVTEINLGTVKKLS